MSQSFYIRSRILSHTRGFTMERKSYQCSECDKAYFHRSQIFSNTRGFTLERSHISVLNVIKLLLEVTSYNHRQNQWIHIREERSQLIRCSECDKAFTQKYQVLSDTRGFTVEGSHISVLKCRIMLLHRSQILSDTRGFTRREILLMLSMWIQIL
ncbi:unnamed protein product [Staurois parvus]|uniref:Uncharacterized protein n=1 Tax=Staurois parvus TaxID=386267 RepID=A0ABN9AQM4_9NEOB|nr:unnamed protein product [Staurois parvus]